MDSHIKLLLYSTPQPKTIITSAFLPAPARDYSSLHPLCPKSLLIMMGLPKIQAQRMGLPTKYFSQNGAILTCDPPRCTLVFSPNTVTTVGLSQELITLAEPLKGKDL